MAKPWRINRRSKYFFCLVCSWVTVFGLLAAYFFFVYSSLSARISSLRSAVMDEDTGHRTTRMDLEESLWRNASSSIDNIGSSAIRDHLKEVLSVPEATDSRAAFDKVVVLSSLLPRVREIPRMKTPSPNVFRDNIAPVGLPVILTDMFHGEKLSHWTWEYVRSKWGKTIYPNTRQGNYSTKTSKSGKHYINRVTVTLDDFIDIATGKRKGGEKEKAMYIAKKRVIPVEALESEFSYPPFYPGNHKKCYLEPTGWIGTPGTFTQGHIDSKDNFVYQIIGHKRWTIFSPQDYKFLYYTETKGSLEWSAALNSFDVHPDPKEYPLYQRATPVSFVMSPGEVLYLPRGWTHTAANLTPNLMINVWRYGPAAITRYWVDENNRAIQEHCY